MKSLYLMIFFFSFIFLFSCSKEEIIVEESALNYVNLEVGNYWIYSRHREESDGSEADLNKTDTVTITGDTLISDRKYFIRSGSFWGQKRTELLFDSTNSIFIYPSRDLVFTLSEDISEMKEYGPPEKPLAVGAFSLDNSTINVSVPAGEFECLDFKGVVTSLDPDYQLGERIFNSQYAENVGLVFLQIPYYNTPVSLRMKLIEFGKN